MPESNNMIFRNTSKLC